jgi:putative two-component system protein, hydrogenase maturation factor HypX/HoxX
MRILFITTAHNSLSQRLQVELTDRGHDVAIHLATTDAAMMAAVKTWGPDLIVAPMLKQAIPRAVWDHHPCFIVHPGIRGDRGPSSLDWAIARNESRWGVTVLQAEDGMDTGPVWATDEFDMPPRPEPKSRLYRGAVTEAGVRTVLRAIERFERRDYRPAAQDESRPGARGTLRPLMKQADRAVDWSRDSTADIARRIHAADGSPGVLDNTLFGADFFLYGAHEEDRLRGAPGAVVARRDGAICIGTVDGALWLSHLKARNHGQFANIKLPAAHVLGARVSGVPERPLDFAESCGFRTFREIVYRERRAVGYLSFDFSNGAMSTGQCRRLREAYRRACARPTRVIVLMGGRSFFSNGIHLNVIEAARDSAAESWANINAIDDLIRDIIETRSHLVIAALRGNAGAGGAMMALAADRVFAREGVVLNPHYAGMGGLFGSEYWTYTLPRRVGARISEELTEGRLTISARYARSLGFLDDTFGGDLQAFEAETIARAESLASGTGFRQLLDRKREQRSADERRKPLAVYRAEELARMARNFFGPDPAYHEARHRFVYKTSAGTEPAGSVGDSAGGRLHPARANRSSIASPGSGERDRIACAREKAAIASAGRPAAS